jgi:6,7-dimethyl-8-ribityllumazine synthase
MRAEHQPSAPLGDASPFRFAVIVSRFNETITGSLRDAAVAALKEAGASETNVHVFSVPGAYEIPQAARVAAENGRFDAIVCLGCIIRGETPHFDYIASEAASGLQLAAIETGIPVSFGVLTVENVEQGEARIDRAADAVLSALEMADVFAQLRAVAPAGS